VFYGGGRGITPDIESKLAPGQSGCSNRILMEALYSSARWQAGVDPGLDAYRVERSVGHRPKATDTRSRSFLEAFRTVVKGDADAGAVAQMIAELDFVKVRRREEIYNRGLRR